MEVCDQYILAVLGTGLRAWRAGIAGPPRYTCGDAMGCCNMQLDPDDCAPGYVEKAKPRYNSKGVLSKSFQRKIAY